MPTPEPDLLAEVAGAVKLQEGSAGVRNVLRAIRDLDGASTKAVSRASRLPLPVVAAINNELRARGVLTRDRPSRLTARGQALVDQFAPTVHLDITCPRCHTHGIVVPPELDGLADELAVILARAPSVDLTLDQSHSTVDTKLRRVLLLLQQALLPGENLLLIGDDDLVSIALAHVAVRLGVELAPRLAVVDISADLLDFIGTELARLGVEAELVHHDLREPLPASLRGGFELAMTDPPYTTDGATLFLDRAVEGLSAGPGRTIGLSFGPKGPRDAMAVQDAFGELGLVVNSVHQDFNDYHGAGVIGAHSNLHLLGSTHRTASVLPDSYAGPIYTADKRAADRWYLCLQCRKRYEVGPGSAWPTIGALKQASCEVCGSTRFRPLSLIVDRDPR